MTRKKYSIAQLDEKLINTFKKLFEQQRYDSNKINSLADIFALARYVGLNAKRKYVAIEALLASAEISEIQITSNDVWTFSLYQTLRQIEIKDYNKQHIYTSAAGKANAKTVRNKLNDLIPNWVDTAGQIRTSI
jgi:Flp pilus assembly CpaF family ATPase